MCSVNTTSTVGHSSQFQKNKNSRTSKHPLHPLQDSVTSEVDITPFYSFHTNKSTKQMHYAWLKSLYLLQEHNMHNKFANLRRLLIGTTTIYILSYQLSDVNRLWNTVWLLQLKRVDVKITDNTHCMFKFCLCVHSDREGGETTEQKKGNWKNNFGNIVSLQRLRWSRGSVLAFGTQVRGFKPGRSRRIFKGK